MAFDPVLGRVAGGNDEGPEEAMPVRKQESGEPELVLARVPTRCGALADELRPVARPVGDRVRRGGLLGAVLVAAGGGCTDLPTAPESGAFCATRAESAVPTFEDPLLEEAIRSALSLLAGDALTCGAVAGLTALDASYRGIRSLDGIENLTGLTDLRIRGNSIRDVEPLGHLGDLTSLNLAANSITDIAPLRSLTSLTFLAINDNGGIRDLGPLAELTGLSGTLWLGGNSITDLGPLGGLTGLTGINAWDNAIADTDALSGLAGLEELRLQRNELIDLGGLRGLDELRVLWLHTNPELEDVGPLLDNAGLGPGTTLNLSATRVSCADVGALRGKGASVLSDCP